MTNHEVSSHTTHTPQPSLPPPLLPPPWLHLQQNVYVGAAARVKACEGMGAESDDDLEGRGRCACGPQEPAWAWKQEPWQACRPEDAEGRQHLEAICVPVQPAAGQGEGTKNSGKKA
eukprot:scaffold2060_cov23-Tisochrysis_lutea.AAC.1